MPELLRRPTADVAFQLTRLADRLGELAQRDFLEAAMGASALVAMADGVLHPAEAGVLDTVRAKVRELAAFDADLAAGRYRQYLEALRADRETGRQRVMTAVGRLAGDEQAGPLLIQMCLIVAVADRSVSQTEFAAIRDLSDALGIRLDNLES